MTTSRCLHDAYGDLLSRGADPSDLEIVAALDRGFSPARTRIPPARVFTTIDQVVEAHRARLRRRWWRPAVPKLRQPLPLVLAVLVVLLLAGAGYRAVPLLERAFDGDQGAHYVMTEHLATPLDLSQTSNGYTLTLKGAYADANQVLLVLTLHGPDTIPPLAEFSIFPDTRLIDAGGAAISPDSGGNMSEGGVASVTYAITSPLDANTLHLHWVIPHLSYRLPADSGAPASDAAFHPVAGPFVFDFAVPVQPSRVAEPMETVMAGGEAVTLERVVVSPTAARFYLRSVAMSVTCAPSVDGWTLDEWRAAHPATDTSLGGLTVTQDGLAICSLPFPLMQATGQWTLRVEPGAPLSAGFQGVRRGGPWVFHFTLPAAR